MTQAFIWCWIDSSIIWEYGASREHWSMANGLLCWHLLWKCCPSTTQRRRCFNHPRSVLHQSHPFQFWAQFEVPQRTWGPSDYLATATQGCVVQGSVELRTNNSREGGRGCGQVVRGDVWGSPVPNGGGGRRHIASTAPLYCQQTEAYIKCLQSWHLQWPGSHLMYQNPLQYPDLKIFLDIVYVPDGGDGGINHTSLLSVDRGIDRGRHTTRLGVTRRGKVFVHLRILWKAYHTEMF